MKLMISALLPVIMFGILNCKDAHVSSEIQRSASDEIQIEKDPAYPETMQKIFKAHGGMENWQEQKTLSFVMDQEAGPETHTIDLRTRMDKVTAPAYSMGFDGSRVWLDEEDKKYDGDAIFYHNLMFYFYAMPFVLGDKGIQYGETQNLEFEGRQYPGVSIGFGDGVGTSPKDQYYLHYDPETYRMTWLGYTVTYRSGAPSDNIKWIHYNNWQEVDGLLLPASITWHDYKGRTLLKARDTATFNKVKLSTSARPDSFYSRPERGQFIERK